MLAKEEEKENPSWLPEMNSNSNRVHGVSMTPNEKSSKKYPLEPESQCIQVRDLETRYIKKQYDRHADKNSY